MTYKSLVVVREVWDNRDLPSELIDGQNSLNRALLTTRFEPEDLNGLEMALKIKDSQGGSVTALSIGAVKNVDVLRECLYRGVDEVIRVEAEHIESYDTLASAHLIAAAIKKVEAYDLVFTGVNRADGENALLGATVAKLLEIEHISYVDDLDKIDSARVACKRAVEMGYEVVSAKLPALINVGVALLKEDPRTPRSAKATLKLKLKKAPIVTWGLADLNLDNPITRKLTEIAGHVPVIQKAVQARKIDPQSASELKEMLHAVLKGT